MDWKRATQRILDGLDIRAEYTALGVQFAGNQPSASGWLPCHVFGGDDGDNNPSAGVCVSGEHPKRGRYKEFTGDGRNLSLFEFAVVAGRFGNWKEARAHYAKIAGVKLPKKDKTKRPADHLVFRPGREHQIRAWTLTKPPIAESTAIAAGAVVAGWPAVDQRFTVVALPVYGPSLVDADPTGWIIWNKTGRTLSLPAAKGHEPTKVKMLTVGGSKSGWINRDALQRLSDAEIVWKTEGPTDCLALASAIPEPLRGRHVAITNAGGASECLAAEFWDHLAGKTVYVLHDCDEPGQTGAKKQIQAAAAIAAECRNVVLPYPIEKKHGKDVRDWLAEGHSYEELLTLAETVDVAAKPTDETPPVDGDGDSNGLTKDTEICRALGMDVLGERPSREILVYAQGKTSMIPKISQFKYADLLQIAGPNARAKVYVGNPEGHVPGTHHFDRVREAVAVLGGYRRIFDQTTKGSGVWPGRTDRLILVGGREAAIWDAAAGTMERTDRPMVDGFLLDLGAGEPWYDFHRLSGFISDAASPEWRFQVVDEAVRILGLWRWASGPGTATAVVGLVLATWLQTCWRWRPQVALIGESQCGKSTLMETLAGMFGALAVLSEHPSEAGLRQDIKNRACAVLIDEFETNHHRRRVLELLRTSGTGSRILRGTAGQGGISFGLKHICWVGAIEVGLERQPDANRYLSFEVRPPTPETRAAFRLPPSEDIAELGERLLAVAIRASQRAFGLVRDLSRHQVDGFDARAIESLAVPAAMIAAAVDESDGAAVERLEFFARHVQPDQGHREPDQEQLMHAILGSIVRLDQGKLMSVGQLIAAACGDSPHDATEALERVGVVLVSDTHSPRSFLASPSAAFLEPRLVRRHLLGGTPWADQSVDTILLRLEGASRSRNRLGGTLCRGVKIDWTEFESRFLCEDEVKTSF